MFDSIPNSILHFLKVILKCKRFFQVLLYICRSINNKPVAWLPSSCSSRLTMTPGRQVCQLDRLRDSFSFHYFHSCTASSTLIISTIKMMCQLARLNLIAHLGSKIPNAFNPIQSRYSQYPAEQNANQFNPIFFSRLIKKVLNPYVSKKFYLNLGIIAWV